MKAAPGNKRRLYGATLAALVGACVTVFVFILYIRTLAPTVLYYDWPLLLDTAMLQVQAIVLGIPGGTGSPTWVMLTHLFTYLPVGDSAYRTNISSAVYAAVAVSLVYWAGLLLSRRVAAAAAGALVLGLSDTFWSMAVIAEIYDLHALLIMLPIIALLAWRERRRDRYLLLAAFLMGFALTNHMTAGLVLPAGLLFVAFVEWRKLFEWRLVLKGAGLFIIGLTPYLYLPVRASMDPPLNEWNPTSFERFWTLVSGGDHHNLLFVFGPAELPNRLMLYGEHLFANLHWGLVMFGVTGFVVLIVRARPAAALLGTLYFGWLFHALEYNIRDVELYFITTYVVLALCIAAGLGAVLEVVEETAAERSPAVRSSVAFAVSAAVALLPLVGVLETYAKNDMSDAYRGRETLEAVVERVEKNATILHHRSELWYLVLVEKRRQDLTIIDPWFPGRVRYTDIVWPDDINYVTTNLRYGTNDFTGVSTAREAAENGPVYILDQPSARPHFFYDAGFSTLQVEGDVFELVPPGREPYTER